MANVNVSIGSRLRRMRSQWELEQLENNSVDIANYIYSHYDWKFKNDMQISLTEVPCEKTGRETWMISYQLTWCNSGTKKTRCCKIFKSECTCNRPEPIIHDYHGYTALCKRLRNGTLNKILK